MRDRITRLVESGSFQAAVLALILVNAVILGVETLAGVKEAVGAPLKMFDRIIIYAFTVEVALRIYAHRASYFRNGWNVFDFIIVLVSLFAASSGLAAFRAFRVLRVLRIITVIPRMRRVVSALLSAIPGIASVGIVVVLILYVFAVIAANLYGPAHPELFGDVFVAMYTLFQVMTLEGWPDISDTVLADHPRAWIFFVVFILVATFTMLNLFIAIVVRAVEEDAEEHFDRLEAQNEALRAELAEIKAMLAGPARGPS